MEHLYAHLNDKTLKILDEYAYGDLIPNPLPVCNLGLKTIQCGLDQTYLVRGFDIDFSRLTEAEIQAIQVLSLEMTDVLIGLDKPIVLLPEFIHHLSL